MADAVFSYSQAQNLRDVRDIQNMILGAYEQDLSKNASVSIVSKIRIAWNSR